MTATAAARRVTPKWLSLRAQADAAARSADLAERLARHLPAAGPLVIHDLGGGSGAMGRWLAPRLPGPQHWVVHDRDADLLELAIAAPPAPGATVEARGCDITALGAGDLAEASVIVASALLDMLTADELAGLLGICTAVGCPVLLALSVVGRVALAPAEPLDAQITAAFNAHQRRDRLGPDAVAAVLAELRGTGAEILVRPSPWRLGAAQADLIAAWFEGWVGAACEQEPALVPDAGAYRERRLAQAAMGGLAVTVEHADLLVLP